MLTTPGVRSLPTLPLRALGHTGRLRLPPPLDGVGVTFWFSARVAIFQAIAALGLRRGDAVTLPAFCCGSEVEPFIHAGLIPRFFQLTNTLNPEPESFKAALSGSSAALVTHYFGFAADLAAARAACRAAGVPLFEDCAHGLYSKDATGWLGSHADVAIFSIVKTLPVPDGGALIIKVQPKASLPTGAPPQRQLIAKRTRSLLIRHLQAHRLRPVSWAAHLPRAAKVRFGLGAPEPNRETQAGLTEYARFDPKIGDTRMSPRSMRLFGQTSHGHVRSGPASELPTRFGSRAGHSGSSAVISEPSGGDLSTRSACGRLRSGCVSAPTGGRPRSRCDPNVAVVPSVSHLGRLPVRDEPETVRVHFASPPVSARKRDPAYHCRRGELVSVVTKESCLDEMNKLLGEVLHLGRRTATLNADTKLFGSLPELDSMALISVVLEIEQRFGITFDDEEATAATFATVGTLASLVDRKRSS